MREKGIIRVGGPDNDPKAANFHEAPASQRQRISEKFQFIQTDPGTVFTGLAKRI